MIDRVQLVAAMREAAIEAGQRIMAIYERGVGAESKADGSPVTEADLAAEAAILSRLARAAPDIPIVSEENAASHAMAVPERFFLVDPLDGTKEFIARRGEFTVNIALIEHAVPVLGVVLAPAVGRLFYTAANGDVVEERGGDRRLLRARRAPATGLVAAVSRSHLDEATKAYLARFNVTGEISSGSSLKFCLIAAGEADIYPRFGRTMEWDTAAGDAILRAAGGRIQTPEGQSLRYGKPGFANDGGFVALGAA